MEEMARKRNARMRRREEVKEEVITTEFREV